MEVLRPLDTVLPEQVIDMPKITLHDVIPQRAVLPVPQMAEQFVEVPVPVPSLVTGSAGRRPTSARVIRG